MSIKRIRKGVLLFGASVLLASAAFATEKATVKVYEAVKVGGKALAPGDYQLQWEGNGPNVEVSIRQNGNTIANVPASVGTSKVAPVNTGYATKTESDGSKDLTTLFFAGSKTNLNLDQHSTAQSGSNPGSK